MNRDTNLTVLSYRNKKKEHHTICVSFILYFTYNLKHYAKRFKKRVHDYVFILTF